MTTATKTNAERIQDLLKRGGCKLKNVDAYGSQVVVTARSKAAAAVIVDALTSASFIHRGTVKTVDYAKDRGTGTDPATVVVWRSFFRV